MKHILKKFWIAAAILIILAAVFSSVFRSLTPWAKQYKGEVEHHLSMLLGQPVRIQSMETAWYWFEPVLKLKQVSIHDEHNKSLKLDKLLVGIDLFKSLWKWQIQPGVLYIDQVDLVLREKNGAWSIDGLVSRAENTSKMTPEETQKLLVWLAEQERLVIKHVSADLHFSDGTLLPVRSLNISVLNSGGHYKLKGTAHLDQANATSFELLGDVYFNPYRLQNTKGQIYCSAKRFAPAQLHNFFPKMPQRLEAGVGDVSLWVDLDKGAVSSVQAELDFKGLALHVQEQKNNQLIQSLFGNMSWKRSDSGWQLQADHLKLELGGVTWPENKLLINFDKTQETYQLYAQSILVESLFSEAINWPESLKKIASMKPHGLMTDTQLVIKDQHMLSVLSRFTNLGWSGTGTIPTVNKLSGVLNWQSQEGHLELDSEHATIAFKGYPKQKFDLLNAGIEWKELNDGLRLSIDRLVLSQKELTLSAEGVLDDVTRQSVGRMHLNANFSGKNLEKWAFLLPKEYLKPRLYEWLTKDVKHVGSATGTLTLDGLGKDFPFDTGSGVFSIAANLNDTELFITQKWPLISELEGQIRVNKRNLDVDLTHGNFQGVPVSQMNLRIDDIGNNKETLLIHGIVHGKAQKMIDFVMASPLKEKLTTLKMLTMKGLLLLNLELQVALYPESDDVLAKGEIQFDKNTVSFAHKVGQVRVNEVTGALAFTEQGISRSTLTASVLDNPLTIAIESAGKPKPSTTVLVTGDWAIESLKNQVNLPILAFFKGVFPINAVFTLTENTKDYDSIVLKTNLKGLVVNLPKPLGKLKQDELPLEVTLEFNLEKGVRLKANYANRISSDILFQEQNAVLSLKSGQVRLGAAHALDQNIPGLEVVGTLEGFPLDEWSSVLKHMNSDATHVDVARVVHTLDLKFGNLTLFNQQFDHLALKGKALPNKSWNLTVEQSNVAGELTYHEASNSISGYLHRLHLAELKLNNNPEQPSKIQPHQIPNLNIRADNVTVGKLQIGTITLKSKSSKGHFAIDYCHIDSPVYQFDIKGDWTQKDKVNKTNVQVKLHLNDLAKSLERWNSTPAVNAGNGDLEFIGAWNNTLFDFSLASLNGTMYLKLKNGIITHLSPETEEKLGLGKLLSILSLQTIPRRLQLDFSDLSHDGYSFDVFKGNFSINKGIMSTQDSYLDGPVAYAGMKGDLDLVRRLYDLNLRISPHITASLPVVATIAGGPIAGLAAWVANKIINQGMQKIIAYSYKISGPWNQPVVQQLSMVKKAANERKTQ